MVVGCTNPVLLQMLGLQCLSAAFSLISAFRGLAAMLGPPMAGILVDHSNQIVLAIYMAALVRMSSALMALVTQMVNIRCTRRQQYIQLD